MIVTEPMTKARVRLLSAGDEVLLILDPDMVHTREDGKVEVRCNRDDFTDLSEQVSYAAGHDYVSQSWLPR